MLEVVGNLWEYEADAKCITTNGVTRKDGAAVMGRGVALQCKQRYPGIEFEFGRRIREANNHVTIIGREAIAERFPLIVFPVKHRWDQAADLALIERSAHELVRLVSNRWKVITLPRPGCGNGQRSWEEVRPIIEPILDDRFVVVSLEGAE